MTDSLSRRQAIKTIGAVSAGILAATEASAEPAALDVETGPAVASHPAPEIIPYVSTSEVFIPPRGRSYNTFSFDFPEPSVEFDGLRFGFIVFTPENAYALDSEKMSVQRSSDGLVISCNGFT